MATTKHAAVPSLIKAVRIAQYGGSEQLKYEEAPLPEIGPGHVLAKVRYAGCEPDRLENPRRLHEEVPPGELSADARAGFRGRDRGGWRRLGPFPNGRAGIRVRRRDVCGVHGGGDYRHRGDSGENGIRGGGGAADSGADGPAGNSRLCAAEAGNPDSDPRRGGRVGSFATQIAKRWGAQVIGTASGEDIVYLRSLGHVQVVDYKQERFETVGQVDAVLDLVGGETATRSFAVVKKGGVMVSTVGAANAELAARAGIRGVNMVSKGSAADLSELAGLVERGDVKPRMGEVFRLEQAREAQDASQQGRAKGKILLKVA